MPSNLFFHKLYICRKHQVIQSNFFYFLDALNTRKSYTTRNTPYAIVFGQIPNSLSNLDFESDCIMEEAVESFLPQVISNKKCQNKLSEDPKLPNKLPNELPNELSNELPKGSFI